MSIRSKLSLNKLTTSASYAARVRPRETVSIPDVTGNGTISRADVADALVARINHLRSIRLVLIPLWSVLLWPLEMWADDSRKAVAASTRRPAPQADGGGTLLYNVHPSEADRKPEPNQRSLVSHQAYKHVLRKTGHALDEMQQKFEEFGSITMSSPIFARPHKRFSFDLHIPPGTLFHDAKNQREGTASAALSIATLTSIAGSAQVDLDRLALAKIALRNFETADRAFLQQQQLNTEIKSGQFERVEEQYLLRVKNVERKKDRAEEDYQRAVQRADSQLALEKASNQKAREKAGAEKLASDTDARTAFDRKQFDIADEFTAKNQKADNDLANARAAIDPKIVESEFNKQLAPAEQKRAEQVAINATAKRQALQAAQDERKKAIEANGDKEMLALDAAKTADSRVETAREDAVVAAAAKRDEALKAAEQDLVTARKDRDDERKELNPAVTAPTRPTNEGTGNVPNAADNLGPGAEKLLEEMARLRSESKLLPAETSLSLPNRAAIQQAAGDTATLNLLNFLGDPVEAAKFDDKVLLYGVVTVGVNPGWRTKKNFAATVTTKTVFKWQRARPAVAHWVAHSEDFPPSVRAVANAQLTGRWQTDEVGTFTTGVPASYIAVEGDLGSPLVAGITPLNDTQTLDLKDQYQRQDVLTLQLALALRQQGAEGQAKAFHQFAKQQQKAAATRSSGGVVNTFSALGGLFGFQVGPRLKALEDPASRRGGSANVLDRQSFPALLFFGLDRGDLVPKVRIIGGPKQVKDAKGGWHTTGSYSYELVEPAMSLDMTPRWNPIKHGTFAWEHWYNPLNWKRPRFSETERMGMMIEQADAFNGLAMLKQSPWTKGDASYRWVEQTASSRSQALSALISGAKSEHRLPLEVLLPPEATEPQVTLPQVSEVVPSTIAVAMKNETEVQPGFTAEVVLLGTDLDMVHDISIIVGAGSAKIIDLNRDHPGALRVRLSFNDKVGPLFFKLKLDPDLTFLGTNKEPYSLLTPPVFLTVGVKDAKALVETPFLPGVFTEEEIAEAEEIAAQEAAEKAAKAAADAEKKNASPAPKKTNGTPPAPAPVPGKILYRPAVKPDEGNAGPSAARKGRGVATRRPALDLFPDELPLPK